MLLIINLSLTVLGFLFFILSIIEPRFQMVYLHYISLIILVLPWIIDYATMKKEDTLHQTDKLPKWKTIIDFIDRNRDVHSVIADRPYHALSFLQCPGLGLIENKGKDSVLKKGSKKYVLALENCEHTPDPDMMNASSILWELGIQNSYQLKKLLNGQYLDSGDYKLMGQVMLNMHNYEYNHGGRLLIKEWMNYQGKNQSFHPSKQKKVQKTTPIEAEIDHVLTQKQGGERWN